MRFKFYLIKKKKPMLLDSLMLPTDMSKVSELYSDFDTYKVVFVSYYRSACHTSSKMMERCGKISSC